MEYVDDIKWYLNQIKGIPQLTSEEEYNLINLYKNEDKKARDKIIEGNLKHIVLIAKIYYNNLSHHGLENKISFGDLMNEGSIGLIEAVDKFDIDRGVRLITYAGYNVHKKISLAVYFATGYKVFLHKQTYKIFRKKSAADQSLEEIDMIDEETIFLESSSQDMALSNEMDEIDELEDKTTESIEQMFLNKELRNTIIKLIASLPKQERRVIEMRFGLNGNKRMILKQIAVKLNLSVKQVRLIEKKALYALRDFLADKELKSYLFK